MASTRVSFTEARRNFARLIKLAEHGNAIEITRRGEPVAVLIAASAYAAITGEHPSFIETATRVHGRMGVDDLGIGDADFDDLREPSTGREISA